MQRGFFMRSPGGGQTWILGRFGGIGARFGKIFSTGANLIWVAGSLNRQNFL